MEHVMDLRRRRRVGNLKEGVQSEDLSINGRIIFNWMINKQAGSVCGQTSFGAAEDMWRAVVKTVMNTATKRRVP
jgi:hypothetical protein